MLFTAEQLAFLDSRYDEKYVGKIECKDNIASQDKKFANDDTRIKLFEQKLSLWEKLFWTMAGSSIGQLGLTLIELLRGV